MDNTVDFQKDLLRLISSFDGAIIPDESAAHAIYQFEAHGCDAAFYRTYLSPKGFVLPAEGFSPAARVMGQPAAAGLKPSAPTTKAGTQRVPGGLFAKPCSTPEAHRIVACVYRVWYS
jgi:hypothetical protein